MDLLNRHSLFAWQFLSLAAFKSVQAGKLNPFNPDPDLEDEDGTGNGKDVTKPKVYIVSTDLLDKAKASPVLKYFTIPLPLVSTRSRLILTNIH